jgi:hypothetical protein
MLYLCAKFLMPVKYSRAQAYSLCGMMMMSRRRCYRKLFLLFFLNGKQHVLFYFHRVKDKHRSISHEH